MIADLKPYPAYKDSGVPWLGEVPEHWEVRRLKRVCSRSALYGANTAATSYTATGIRFLRTTDITEDGHLKSAGVFLPEETVRDYLLADGDLLISRSGTIGRSFLYDSKMHGPCAYAGYLVRFIPAPDVLPRYVFLFTKTQTFVGFLRVMAISSTIENVNGAKYANAELSFPPPAEQFAIVRFLDHADRRIRRYIRAKQKLIKLLEEQKQAIIHRAVTRGLDPNVRLKPSGVEWLGDVPRHWEVVRSGSLFRLFGGFAFPGTGFVRDESDEALPVLLTPVNFDPVGGLRFGSKSTVRFRGNMPEQFKLRKGALVTVLTDLSSKRLILGRAGFIEHDGVLLNQRTARVDIHTSIRSRLNAQYLCWVLNSRAVREQTISTSRGSTVFHTSPTRMLAARWPLPPLEEQLEIVERLETLERTQRAAYERLGYEIELLREYRTRLIADVVTGKLDVRGAAARLPDEVDEPEARQDTDTLTEGDADTDEADLDAVPDEAKT